MSSGTIKRWMFFSQSWLRFIFLVKAKLCVIVLRCTLLWRAKANKTHQKIVLNCGNFCLMHDTNQKQTSDCPLISKAPQCVFSPSIRSFIIVGDVISGLSAHSVVNVRDVLRDVGVKQAWCYGLASARHIKKW